MKSFTKSLSLALFAALVLFACKPDTVAPRDNTATGSDSPSLQADSGPHQGLAVICSGVETLDLAMGGSTLNPLTNTPWAQSVQMLNGQDTQGADWFAIDYQLQWGWYVRKQETFVGQASELTFGVNGVPEINPNWLVEDINPVVNSWSFLKAVPNFNSCDIVVAKLTIGQINPWGGNPNEFTAGSEREVWLYNSRWNDATAPQMASANALQTPWCYVPCSAPEVCTRDFTTYNQCGYGLCGQDGPAADLRDALFTTAFPNGLQLGCANGYNMTLTSSQAVNDFLPSKGGKILTNNMTDPTGRFANPNDKICNGFAPTTCFQIDFNTDAPVGDNGNALLSGTYITNQYDEVGLSISGVSNHSNRSGAPIIFDSNNPTGGDFDLGTPNEAYGGPGRGNAGTNPMGRNDEALGNLIILAENVNDNNNDGRVDNPDDDAAGGVIYFDFATPISVEGLDLVDLDDHAANEIILQFADGTSQMWECPQIGNNSRKFVSTQINGEAAHGVARISVSFSGSGAVAGLSLCRPGNLAGACINDGAGFASTLAGRLAAAKMNVAFDIADPNLGPANFKLKNMEIRVGDFQGMSVAEVIIEADKFLGGCGSTFTKGKLNSALKRINDSFRDGTRQNNYLICP